jgi:hypothetical protein
MGRSPQNRSTIMKLRFHHKPIGAPVRISDEEVELTVGDAIMLARRVWFGSPGTCPNCGGQGMLAWIDADRGRSRSWCEACDVEWDLVETADGRAVRPGDARS